MDLKLKVINQVVQAKNLDCKIRDRYHASEITVCPPSDDARKLHKLPCIDRKCQECGVDAVEAYLQPLDVAAEEEVSWQVWGNTTVRGNLRKALLPRSGQLKELIQEMKSELKILPNHLFQARWQQQKFWEIVKNPPKDSVVCIMDFAENYTCLLQNEQDLDLVVERHFLGSRHGKSPCDGEGGVVKSAAARTVKVSDEIINSPESFFRFCEKELTKPALLDSGTCSHSRRCFYFVPLEQVVRERQDRVDVCTVPGTRQIHVVRGREPYNVQTRRLSCFCKACEEGRGECADRSYTGPWVDRVIKLKKQPDADPSLDISGVSALFPSPDSDVGDLAEMGDLVDDLIEDLESGNFQLEKSSPTVMRVQNRPTSGEKTERRQLDTKQLYRCSDLKKDGYYAVYYDRAYYIGRVTDHCLCEENALKNNAQCINRATGICRKIVGHFSHSWKKRVALREAQRELDLPEHAMVTDCSTRWGSTQKMIGRVLEQKSALSKVLSTDRKVRHLLPSWQDLEVLESVNKALSPLQDFTDALSGERYVSISCVKPTLHLLNTSVLAEDEADTDLTKSLKSKILSYLNNKYEGTQDLLNFTTFLDPRFQTQYISEEETQTFLH
ncbi:unnamed protein product [Leuciscus chuanchicus]